MTSSAGVLLSVDVAEGQLSHNDDDVHDNWMVLELARHGDDIYGTPGRRPRQHYSNYYYVYSCT